MERRKGGTWLQALWVWGDLLSIGLGFWLGYLARFRSPVANLVPPTKGIPPIEHYLLGALVTAFIWVPLFSAMGLYRLERGRTFHRPKDLIRGLVFGMVAVAALSFFYRGASYSRLAAPFIWAASAALLLLFRAAAHHFARVKLRPIRFALVGSGPLSERLVAALAGSSYPHRFEGTFGVEGEEVPAALGPRLGGPETIGARAEGLDLVLLAAAETDPGLVRQVLEQCQEHDLDFEFVPDLVSLWGKPARVDEIAGLPVIRLRELPLSGWNGVLKRSLDIVVSALLLALLSPLLLLLAALVKLDSPGPVFHRQERMGRDLRGFTMLKFRSMRIDAERESGPVWARKDDPRRTRVGAFLRRWSLDELPQLLNVLLGQMSLVGPRPERRFFVEQFEVEVDDYRDRHRIKSGVTGWAQVHGLRGNVPIEERTRYDLYYVEHWSLWLDLRILWMTLRAVVRHRGD